MAKFNSKSIKTLGFMKSATFLVLVAALGYFVDIYDLLLFGIVRVSSLKALGYSDSACLDKGILLVNLQMIGMLFGGIMWGVIGDKKGRVSVLFGSILIYSLANIFNAFVSSLFAYGFFRFAAGIGLAGELGAAITLVSESLSKERRGLGTTAVASVGIMGAVFAGIVADFFDWRTCYLIGGVMGLLLLGLRLTIYESGMFQNIRHEQNKRGDLRMLLYPFSRFLKYLRCILVGVPIWFVIGILITFAPELSRELGVTGPVTAGKSILFCYLGGSIGNLVFGFLSQTLESRRKVIFISLTTILGFVGIYLFTKSLSPSLFYILCGALGFGTGYWVVFMTATTEQFGTNLRATVTTTVPNFVRGSVVILTSVFLALQGPLGLIQSAWVIGLGTITLALVSLYWIEDTFGRDLNYSELDL